jgi:hypothetical protein
VDFIGLVGEGGKGKDQENEDDSAAAGIHYRYLCCVLGDYAGQAEQKSSFRRRSKYRNLGETKPVRRGHQWKRDCEGRQGLPNGTKVLGLSIKRV